MSFAAALYDLRVAALREVFAQMPDAELVSIAADNGTILLDAAVDRAGKPVYPSDIDWTPVEECFGHSLTALQVFHVSELRNTPGHTEAVLRGNTTAMWGGGTPYVLRRPA
jgi:hypothetical protein